eukprot:COSAG02_NODE_4755_length_5022_cov_1.907577_1_plen_139_part_00
MDDDGHALNPDHDRQAFGSNRRADGQFQAVLGLVHLFGLRLLALPSGELLTRAVDIPWWPVDELCRWLPAPGRREWQRLEDSSAPLDHTGSGAAWAHHLDGSQVRHIGSCSPHAVVGVARPARAGRGVHVLHVRSDRL